MKITSNLFRKSVLWLACVCLLASCMPGSTTNSSGIQSWIDQPTTGSLLPLAAFTLRAHARPGSSGGIDHIEFLVNDVAIGSTRTDSSLPLVTAETSWNPSAPGSYTVRARAYSDNDYSDSEIASVCVSDQVTTASSGYSGDCANPIAGAGTEAPVPPTGAPSSAPFTIHVEVLDNPVYYGTCTPSTLRVIATLDGDASQVDTVRVSYLYDTLTGTSPFGLGDVAYDANTMSLLPTGTYSWSTNLNTDASRWGLSGGTYMLHVYVEAFDSLFGGIGDQAGPISVRWEPCPTTPVPVEVTAPSVTITQINPADVGYYITGCGPNAITVQAHVSSTAELASVSLFYSYSNGTSNVLSMTDLGGGNYQAVLPLDMDTYNALLGVNGTVTFTVTAVDSNGNTGSANGGPVTLMYCPG